MSGFFKKYSYSTKPAEPREPDFGHPQLQGCVAYAPLLPSDNRIFFRDNEINLDTGAVWGTFQGESGIHCNGNALLPLSREITFAAPYTITAVIIFDTFSGGNQLWGGPEGGAEWFSAYGMYLPDSQIVYTRNLPAEFSRHDLNPALAAGIKYHLAMVVNAATATVCYAVEADTRKNSQTRQGSVQNGTFTSPNLAGHSDGRPLQGSLLEARVYDRALDADRIKDIFSDRFAPFTHRIWIPEDTGIPPEIPLDVASLQHSNRIDSVDIESSYILVIDAATHASRLDECAVTISEAIGLLIENMAHASVLDEPLITPTYTLLPQALAHAHPLDECAAYWRVDLLANGLAHVNRLDAVDVQAAPEIVIDIDSMIHGHALDAIALEYETTFIVDGLRHGHPVDAPDVSALLGLLTTLRRNDTTWRINAGQSVDNAAGVDGLWHVIEAIFDGAGSILSIDGAPVASNAGVRELNSLTLGAELDGGERLTGDVGELLIYNGALTQTQRDKIRAELQAKWL